MTLVRFRDCGRDPVEGDARARVRLVHELLGGRLEQAEQGLVSRNDGGADIAHGLALAPHLVGGHPNPRRALPESLDSEAGPVVLDEVGLPNLCLCVHALDRTHLGPSRNRAFGYVCVSGARWLAIWAPSSARELMPSLR